MADYVKGMVIDVIDGDTFDIEVDDKRQTGTNRYAEEERIRIASIDAPELGTAAGKRSQDALHKKIFGKIVHCEIQARDTYGRLVCDVTIVDELMN